MRALAILGTLLWAGAAQAQSVPVRGGEHDDFTRLVLPVPEGAGWELAPAPGGFALKLPDGTVYDLRRAFDRIPRDRVQSLQPLGRGRLALAVSCDCHAEAALFSGVGLVIDVTDGPAPPGGLAPGRVEPAPTEASLPLLFDTSSAPPAFGPRPSVGPAFLPPVEVLAEEASRVARTEAAILESVAAAASQGLLDVAPAQEVPDPSPPLPEAPDPGDGLPPVVTSPADDAPSPPILPSTDTAPAPSEARPGLAFRTGADTEGGEQAPLGATGTSCLSKEAFDLAAWVGSGTFDVEVAARLAQLTDERDRLDPEAVEALARTYLAFGFGREAAAALDTDGRSSRERDGLRLLARLVDGEAVAPGAFEDQAGCLGPVALWRALARDTLRGTDERERSAMTIALRALPSAVRSRTALRLAALFLEEGDALGAAEVAALAEGSGTEALLTQAEIRKATEGPAAALTDLESLAETDARMTPEGLVELIDLTIAQGQPVPEDTLALARALRFEHGGGAARMLLLAEARALTADLRFEETLDLLDEERSARPGDDLDAALVTAVAALTEELSDAAFLELALGELPSDLPPEARKVLAQRLVGLGFPAEAGDLRQGREAEGAPTRVLPEGRAPGSVAMARPDTLVEPAQAAIPQGAQGGHEEGQAADWERLPPAAEVLPADMAMHSPAGQALPVEGQTAPPPAPSVAAGAGTRGLPLAGPEPSFEAPDLAGTLATLAGRRMLLDQAGQARARATALLDQAPIE